MLFKHARNSLPGFPKWPRSVPFAFGGYCSSVRMQRVHLYAPFLPLPCTLETHEIPGDSLAAAPYGQEEMPGKKYLTSQKLSVWLQSREISVLYLPYQNTSPVNDGKRSYRLLKIQGIYLIPQKRDTVIAPMPVNKKPHGFYYFSIWLKLRA